MIIFTKQQSYGTQIATLLALFFFTAAASHSQPQTYRITFRDKGPAEFAPGTEAYDSALSLYHANALKRRQSMGLIPLLQSIDQPIYKEYLKVLTNMGLDLRAPSAWRNSVIAVLDTIQASVVSQLSFVKSVVRTALVSYKPMMIPANCSPPDQGASADMHALINTIPLIEHGTSGLGVDVCLIDEGFIVENMSSLSHIDIRNRYDVINNDDNVSIEPQDEQKQGGHGSIVMSIIAGWEQGQLIGVAPFATYLLAKSEDMRFERRSEEDNFYSAVEWAERNGADIISTSVGYYSFDKGQEEMQYAWLDGKTTFVAQAYNLAAQRGVIVVAPAGNYGPTDSTLITPSDADSAISVGGSMRDLTYWPNSSRGPTADGRIKPDVAALAASVYSQTAEGNFIYVSGTSMSAPQISGCMALLKQIFPEAHPWELREGLYTSARVPDIVGDVLGRGIPDVVAAARNISEVLGPGISTPSITSQDNLRVVFTAIYARTPVNVTMQFLETQIAPISSVIIDTLWHAFEIIPSQFITDTLHARITATNGINTRYFPNDSTWFSIPSSGDVIPCGVRLPTIITNVDNSDVYKYTDHLSKPVYLTPSSATHTTQQLVVHNLRDVPSDLCVVASTTGALLRTTWEFLPDGNVIMQLPSLASGHYIVLIRTNSSSIALPFIRI